MNTSYLSLNELETFDSKSRFAGRERRFLCPVCGQNKPRDAAHRSLAVNTETGIFICHRCQTKGRLKEFWESRPIMQKKQKTRMKLISHFALRDSEFVPLEKSKMESPKSENLSEKMKSFRSEFLHSPAEIYLEGRGISVAAAINAGCGFADKWKHWEKTDEKWILKGVDRRVVFPIFDETGGLAAIHGRAIDDECFASAKLTRGDKSQGLFLSDANTLDKNIVAICEGAIDAMALAMCGIPAVAMTGTSPPGWFYKKMAFRHILIATDADEAGDKAAYQIKAELISRGAKTLRLRPKSAKDWGEVLEKIGLDQMQNYLCGFRENLPDESRTIEASKLFNGNKVEAARFVAGLLTDVNLRQNLMFQVHSGF